MLPAPGSTAESEPIPAALSRGQDDPYADDSQLVTLNWPAPKPGEQENIAIP